MNRQERRTAQKRARKLTKAMQHFSRSVIAKSEELKNIDQELPRSEQKKVFTREAKRLVNNKTLIMPRVMIEYGMNY